jgi:hypothetical protein
MRFQTSLKMAPFESLNGRKCRTPLYWNHNGESQVFGPKFLRKQKSKCRLSERI